MGFSLAVESRAPLTAAYGFLTAGASVVVEHRLSAMWASVVVASRLCSCSSGLEGTGSIVVVHGLRCSKACGIFPGQLRNCVSCIGRWILYH